MKYETGKGSIKLIIAIAVIIAVVIFGVNYAMKLIKKENVKNVQADILLVQAKVKIVKGNYSVNKEENPLRGYQLTQLPEDVNISAFLEKNIISQEEYEKYYLIDSTALEQMELQELINKYPGYFIVNYDNYEVIYTEGYENENGIWCYKITDLYKKPEQKNEENTQNSNENNEEQTEQNNEEQSSETN